MINLNKFRHPEYTNPMLGLIIGKDLRCTRHKEIKDKTITSFQQRETPENKSLFPDIIISGNEVLLQKIFTRQRNSPFIKFTRRSKTDFR